jgi:pimeloyl-ACP methyl ester carboxylesterase
MGFVTARGVRFHVMDLPCRSDGPPGEPVVMVHGLFTGSAASWYLMAARTLVADRPVRLLDWRGHGRSERTPAGYGAGELAQDLAALTADLPPFALVTHSYGGLAGLRFVLANPARVTRTVLVEPPLDAAGAGETAEDRARGTVAAGDPTVASDVAAGSDPGFRWLTGQLSSTAARKLDDLIEQTTIRADVAAEPSISDADLRALPPTPLMVVVGADSPFRAAADRLRTLRPDVQAHAVPGGHDVHVTNYREVGALLSSFLGAESPSLATLSEG